MKPISAIARLAGLTLIILCGTGCGRDTSSAYGANTMSTTNPPANTVHMAEQNFSPATITISRNTTVTWSNNDGVAHTATSDSGIWDTGNIPAGGSATTTFTSTGNFPYHCTYHANMKGIVVVQ